ncbi:MAG TPA: 50S ribosomal protein L25 [Candidatus Bipolaricaulota bacterium]|nr:50S ribosomal protein L25 [Candidatus Bipolaricaulota bacterium]
MPYALAVENRELTGKKVKSLRKNNLVPGVIYGPELKENKLVSIDRRELDKVYDKIGESGLIELNIAGSAKPIEVLIKHISYDSVSDAPMSVDFYQTKRGQKIEAEVEIEFINEAPVVKAYGGIVIKNIDRLSIRCLPADLEKVAELKVDLGGLKNFDDLIYVKDLNLPAEIEVLDKMDDVVVFVTEPEEEKVETAAVLEDEMKKVEVAGEKEKEEEGEKENEKGKEKGSSGK